MALQPSNTLANGNVFPNYAGKNDVDEQLRKELEGAGITVKFLPDILVNENKEVKTAMYGEIGCEDMPRIAWHFERAWYYWVAKGPGIPPEYAEELYKAHGKDARVEGHCGCVSPLEYNKGFSVGIYHVDNPEGLKALADTIKKVISDNEKKLELLKLQKLFVVRLYDGFDNLWIDITKPVSEEEANEIWNTYTENGTVKSRCEHIDYYAIFPADTKMIYS